MRAAAWLGSPMGNLQTVVYLAIVGATLAGLAGISAYAALRHVRPAWRRGGRLQLVLALAALAYATLFLLVGGLLALGWAVVQGYRS